MTVKSRPRRPSPPVPDSGYETGPRPAARGRAFGRAAGAGLASLGAPAVLGVADLRLGQIVAAAELAVMLTIVGTALFGSQSLSDRAFRLLRWLGNQPEPPGPAASR